MTSCNSVDTPMEQNSKLLPGKPNLARDVTKFRSIVRSLTYLVSTRPDFAYSVGIASIFAEAPSTEHWAALKRIVRYIAGTTKYGFKYSCGSFANLKLLGYSDIDHAGDLEKRKKDFWGCVLLEWKCSDMDFSELESCVTAKL